MRPRRASLLRAAGAICAVVLLASCTTSGSDAHGGASDSRPASTQAQTKATGTEASDSKGDWTVLAYVNGDNNLEQEALDDIEQMTRAKGTRFIVLVDRSDDYSDDSLLDMGDFTDTRLLKIEDGSVSTISKPGELNMGDPRTLKTFVSSGLKNYGRAHNALVIWDHGGAWNGAAWDDTSGGDNLTLDEINSALADSLKGQKASKFDLIGFDACLMSTYEVAAALAPHANYLLASEEVEPGGGWDWASLSTRGGATTRGLADQIIRAFTKESNDGGAEDTTLSLLNLTALGDLNSGFMKLAKALKKTNARLAPGRIGAGRSATISFGRDPNPENDYFQIDVGDLLTQLAPIRGLGDAVRDVRAALDKVVVTRQNGPVAANAAGMSAYFPPTSDLIRAGYNDLPEIGPWRTFLATYFKLVAAVPQEAMPTWTDTDRLLDDNDVLHSDSDGVTITSEVTRGTGGNITEATLVWGEVDIETAKNVVYYGDRNAVIKGDQVQATYDWNRLMISDGTTTAPAYASLTYDPRGKLAKIIIPIVFQRGSEQAEGTLQLGLRDGKIIAETFYLRIGEGVAGVQPEAGDVFVPILKHQNLEDQTEEWIPASDQPLSANRAALDFSYGKLPGVRAILLGIGISDLRGASDFVYYGTATP